MAKAIKRRRGTTEEHKTFVGLDGEITVDTTRKTLVLHDQETAGGFPMASEAMLNDSVAKIEEEAEQTFITKNGNEDINGIKTFKAGLGITKDTGPTSIAIDKNYNGYSDITIRRKKENASDSDENPFQRVASLRLIEESNNTQGASLIAHGPNGEFGQQLSIFYDKITNTFSSVAPTPPLIDNSTQIATTAWTINRFAHTATLNIYVSKSGNDNNSGLSEEDALLSIKKALIVAASFRNVGYNININIGEGSWSEQTIYISNRNVLVSGNLRICGASKEKTKITCPTSTIRVFGADVSLLDMTIESINGDCISASRQASLEQMTNVKFIGGGSSSNAAINVSQSSYALINTGCSFNYNGGSFVASSYKSSVKINNTDMNGSISRASVWAHNGGLINAERISITGSVTGKRFYAGQFGIIYTANGGDSYFPGTIAGNIEFGGQYL